MAVRLPIAVTIVDELGVVRPGLAGDTL